VSGLEALRLSAGDLWPYLVVILAGFLPTELWRVIGVVAARSLNEESEWLIFVRAIAAGLVAGVVAKLLIIPSGALAALPPVARFGGVVAGLAFFFLVRRSVVLSLAAGEAALIAISAAV